MSNNQSVQQFIVEKIVGLVQSYPHIKMLYTYDEYEREHTVQVSPTSFLSSKEWRLECPIIFKQGYDAFPNQAICFVEEDLDIVSYEKLIFQQQGLSFLSENATKTNIANIQKQLYLPSLTPASNSTSIPVVQSSIKITNATLWAATSIMIKPNISYANAA